MQIGRHLSRVLSSGDPLYGLGDFLIAEEINLFLEETRDFLRSHPENNIAVAVAELIENMRAGLHFESLQNQGRISASRLEEISSQFDKLQGNLDKKRLSPEILSNLCTAFRRLESWNPQTVIRDATALYHMGTYRDVFRRYARLIADELSAASAT